MAVAVQHLNDSPPPLIERRNDLPKPLCDLVHRLLRKKPEERYQTFTEVLDDIRTLAKANRSGTLAEVTIAETESDDSESPTRRLYGQRPWLALTLLILLTGSASAGVGWLMRARVGSQPDAPPKFEKLATAKDEYLRAMFIANNEEAWKSVGKNYRNSPADSLWVQRAEEQLLLFYLKDKSRAPEALKQCDVLESLNPTDQKLLAESRLARAYLAAGQGDLSNARNLLGTYQAQFESQLQGSWRGHYADLRSQVYGGPPLNNGFRPGQGPPGGFGGGGFDSNRPRPDGREPENPPPGEPR